MARIGRTSTAWRCSFGPGLARRGPVPIALRLAFPISCSTATVRKESRSVLIWHYGRVLEGSHIPGE